MLQNVSMVTWHGKGDYFAVVMPHANKQSVCIHQLSKRRSQNPFTKSKGLVQRVLFHPVRPFLFVAVSHNVLNLFNIEENAKLLCYSYPISLCFLGVSGIILEILS